MQNHEARNIDSFYLEMRIRGGEVDEDRTTLEAMKPSDDIVFLFLLVGSNGSFLRKAWEASLELRQWRYSNSRIALSFSLFHSGSVKMMS